jgi:hypothetical protein
MSRTEDENRRVADTIAQRVRVGEDPVVAGWQEMLFGILTKMRSFLAAGRLVTFQHLLPAEKAFYEALLKEVTVPARVLALYMPPSVRHQMMAAYHGEGERILADHDPEHPPDAGVVLAAADGLAVILNALFARPPTMPAVDVYEAGRLIAGYTYRTIDECVSSLSALMRTHLVKNIS